jgi:HEAT repeat protein
MTITFPCTGCGKQYKAGTESAGKQMKCANCGTTVRIPDPRNVERPQSSLSADEVACPHCRATCGVLPEWRGQTLECPTCRKRFIVPAAGTGHDCGAGSLQQLDDGDSVSDRDRSPPRSAAASHGDRRSTEIDYQRWGIIGAVGVVVVVLLVVVVSYGTKLVNSLASGTQPAESNRPLDVNESANAANSSAATPGMAEGPATGSPGGDRLVIPGADASIPAWAGKDKAEPFDVRQFLQSRAAPADNAAPLYLAALAELTTDLGFVYTPEEWRSREPQVRALSDAIGPLADIDRLRVGTVPMPRIEEVLAGAKAGIEKLDGAQGKRNCVFVTGIRYDSELPHAQAARQVARLAQIQVYHGIAKNDFQEVEDAIRRTLRLSRDLRPRGAMICQLVSMAMDAVVASAITDLVLGHKDLSVEQCDRLLNLLVEHQGAATDARAEGYRMEYIMLRHSMAEVQSGRLSVDTLAEMREDPSMRKMDPKRINWERELSMVNPFFSAAIAIAAKPVRETATKQWGEGQIAEMKKQRSQFTLYFIPNLDQFQEAQARWETRLGGVQGLITVRRYELAHGALPPDLEAARKETKLAKIPTDAYSGQPMRYKVVNARPVVYSVGSDLKDDGGTVDWNFGQNPGDFIFKIAPPPAPPPAATRVAKSGPVDSKTLVQDLESSSVFTRREAAEALAKMKPDENQPTVARRLELLLQDNDKTLVEHALDALANWGDKDTATPLKRVLRSTVWPSTKSKALMILVKYADDELVDVVAESLGDSKGPTDNVRAILEQMGPAGEKAAIKVLMRSDAWVFTKRDVAKFVESYSKKNSLSPESVAALLDIVRNDRDHDSVKPLITALATVKEERVADFLATGLDDFWYAKEAKAALIAMGPAAEKSVAKYLKHQKPEVRFTCCEILAVIGTKKSVSALRPLVANNPVGQAAKSAIDAINERAKGEN